MSLFTVRAVLRKDKKNKKGNCPVSICVTIAGKRAYHSSGISVSETYWDAAKERVKPGLTNTVSYNTKIAGKLAKIERDLLEASDKGELSIQSAKAATRPTLDFYGYAERIFKDMEKKGPSTTARRYRNNIPSIKQYHEGALNVGDINKDWLSGYEDFCRGTYKNPRVKETRAIAQNTIWSRFKMLRKILLHAQEAGVIAVCPIGKRRGGYPMPAQEKVPKDYLTMDELDKMLALMGGEGLTDHEDLVLSFFLIECTAGIRHSDWSRFSVEKLVEGDALKVTTKKTGEPVYVPIGEGTRLARVLAHIKERGYKYVLTETAAANKVLKVLKVVAGIKKKVTTHTGRHTCCTLYLEMGYSRETVAEIVGVSMKVIDVYAKMTRQKVRNEFAKLGGL